MTIKHENWVDGNSKSWTIYFDHEASELRWQISNRANLEPNFSVARSSNRPILQEIKDALPEAFAVDWRTAATVETNLAEVKEIVLYFDSPVDKPRLNQKLSQKSSSNSRPEWIELQNLCELHRVPSVPMLVINGVYALPTFSDDAPYIAGPIFLTSEMLISFDAQLAIVESKFRLPKTSRYDLKVVQFGDYLVCRVQTIVQSRFAKIHLADQKLSGEAIAKIVFRQARLAWFDPEDYGRFSIFPLYHGRHYLNRLRADLDILLETDMTASISSHVEFKVDSDTVKSTHELSIGIGQFTSVEVVYDFVAKFKKLMWQDS